MAMAFIDQQLPDHILELANLPIHHHPDSEEYAANSRCLAPPALSLRPRPDAKNTKAMTFWHSIFGDAMQKFKSCTKEPKGRAETVYNIRDKRDWDEIYSVLILARNKYQETVGVLGALRKVRRKGADRINPIVGAAKMASTVAPDNI